MIPRPPRFTRTYTLFPYTTRFRSKARCDLSAATCSLPASRARFIRASATFSTRPMRRCRDNAALAAFDRIRHRQADPQGLRLDRRRPMAPVRHRLGGAGRPVVAGGGSEEHTSELQSLMHKPYAG